ncbi:MAG: hypothetical protein DCO96_10310 [Fluviicola sp. XM-24bin1]|nr:MAG: hypothetical protein DCO96_10310 [Fluviicola sp. XM-24bin1]
MKIVLFFLSFSILFSCSSDAGSNESEDGSKPSLTAKKRKPKKLSVTGDGTPPKTAIHKAWLVCRDKGEDEFEIPHYDVYVEYDSTSHKVGECNACAPLDLQDYHDYDIPKEALAAVGGWFAGAGDYYYVMKTEDDGIRVYAGWQDEGQMEEDDTTFHYKKVYEKHPDGKHKFF